MSNLMATATEYRDSGISIIPLKLDGSKKPAISSWEPFQKRFATDTELSNLFSQPHGIGIVTGTVSGGLEVIDQRLLRDSFIKSQRFRR